MMQLPVGYDDFRAVMENHLDYVDKSLFIQEILDNNTIQVMVIARPRRFGKTLNLSMLHYFLAKEVYGQSTQGLFETLKIAELGETYMRHQGQYPVVALTFKDIKSSNFNISYQDIFEIISDLYNQNEFLLDSPHLTKQDKKVFRSVLEKEADETMLKASLRNLIKYLFLHYKKKMLATDR